jgi:hypothetical protein
VRERLGALHERIARAGFDPTTLSIVAVTKGFPADHVDAAAQAGLRAVGENYAQELIAKREACDADIVWQFIGPIQTNKVPALCRVADLLAGVARVKEIEAIARQPRRPPIYLQIDYTGEAQRHGAPESEIDALLECARGAGIDVRGLMTVAPPEPERAAAAFASLSALADEHHLAVRSMGMSDDLELALAAGTTEIRVGRALFGSRPGA